MKQFKIKLRKESLIKTLYWRFLFYNVLILIATSLLCAINSYVEQNSIFLSFYLIIIALIVITFQYLIYAKSINGKISLTNFKNTITETDSKNLIRLLFPEFKQLYQLEDSFDDTIIFPELEKITHTSIIEEKSLEIEDEFKSFIKAHLDDLAEYDIVIKMKRKGEAIFNDLIDSFPQLEKLIDMTNYSIFYENVDFKDMKILIFDDSIHLGNNARSVLNVMKSFGFKKILYLTVVAQENTLASLKVEYSESDKIHFCSYQIKKESEYGKFYSEYMFGYLEHVNSQTEKDSATVRIKVNKALRSIDFKSLFDDNGNYVYEVERVVGKKTEKGYKISLECPWIYEKLKGNLCKKTKMDMVKVRFFVKPNRYSNAISTDVFISPLLVPRELSRNICDRNKINEICSLDDFMTQNGENLSDNQKEKVRDQICINCLVNDVTQEFIDEFMRYFKEKLIQKLDASVIKEDIDYPLPNEVYPNVMIKLREEE